MSDHDGSFGPSTYGDRIADVYDGIYPDIPYGGDVATTVDFLASLAGAGPALELGIGTGRVALPLTEAGVEVHGIDASAAMVERLRMKPGGGAVPVTMGDFRDFSLGLMFTLIYIPFNTFFGLLTQDDQVTCFRTVARHLAPGGVFVMEAFVPDPARFDRSQRVSAVHVATDEVSFEVTKHDPVGQYSETQHVVIREDGIRLYPVRIRFAYVSELDLMSQLTGFRLRERWADWDRTPFSSVSGKHISVWELDPDAAA